MADPQLTVDEVRRTAVVSPDGVYRYMLGRRWGDRGSAMCGWVMLNPSTADSLVDDPTIRRCMGFARGWGFAGIRVVNLFGLRATDPRVLAVHADPVGPENLAHVQAMLRDTGFVVAAWGASLFARPAVPSMVRLAEVEHRRLRCVGVTSAGAPRHPLYVRGDVDVEVWPS